VVGTAAAQISQIHGHRAMLNVKHHLYFMRLSTGNQCNKCSSGAAWLKAGSEQTKQAALFRIRCSR